MCVGGVVKAAENVVILLLLCVHILQYHSTSFEPINMNFSKHKSKKDRLVCQLLLCSCHEPHSRSPSPSPLHLAALDADVHTNKDTPTSRTRCGSAVYKKRSAALCHHCIAQATPEHHPLLTDTWTGKTPRWPWPPGDSALSSFNSNSFLSSGRIQIAVDYHEDCPGPLLSALCCICRCLWLFTPSYKNDNLRQSAGRDRGVTDLSCVCVCSSSWSQWNGSRSVSLLLTCTCTLIYRHQHQCVLSTEPVLEAVNEELAAESGLCVRRTLIWQQGQKWPSLTKLVFNLWMSAEKVLTFQGRSPERWQRLRRKMLPKVVITLNSWMYLRDPANCSP